MPKVSANNKYKSVKCKLGNVLKIHKKYCHFYENIYYNTVEIYLQYAAWKCIYVWNGSLVTSKINKLYSHQTPYRSNSAPHVEPYSDAVYKPIDDPKNDIRIVAIRALTKFMLTLNKNYSAASMRPELTIGQSLLGYTGNSIESLFPLYFEGIKDNRKEIRQISVIGLHMLWAGDKSYKMLPTVLEALCTAMSQERHSKTLFEMCRVLMFLIFCESDYLYIPLADLVPVFKCFQLLLTLRSENLLLVLDKIILAGVFVMHMYQPPMQPKHQNDSECYSFISWNCSAYKLSLFLITQNLTLSSTSWRMCETVSQTISIRCFPIKILRLLNS